MKKEETKVEVKAKVIEKPIREKSTEMKQFNEMQKQLKWSAWRFVKRIEGSEKSAEMMAKLQASYDKVIELIMEMTNETMLAFRFAHLNDAEKAYLKKLLENYNA